MRFYTETAINTLRQKNIEFITMTRKELEIYKKKWFDVFVPHDKHEEALHNYCFPKDGYCGYLWHVFSFETLTCFQSDKANSLFDSVSKREATLLVNIDEAAYKIKDASRLTAKDIHSMYDVILTDVDFAWTYAKTHERACGPYFYESK
ncbi:MAG: DUF4275 family protein [Firmicutes bacterium]|nr:DUF4275 family protein [Bacillota bacterium]